ncbi:B3/B4 domain-containing protein [Massilibacteroides vaginae]|uniref:B3/B4 domain-containing protein n=1 Tax=Massilibacteroides vaginae TaxID=1673718 RepID=UPI000A1C8324|nr:phenylalanine--tRNA ligase beta subunit-related protein [Massilibacteroides vaginae]
MKIELSNEIKTACPDLHVLIIRAQVKNTPYDTELWQEIARLEQHIRSENKLEGINKIPTIQATRQAYKKLGKDPNRYRPSAEALHRRIHRGLPLYQINTLVDLINLISIKTGYSIGGFDANKIEGDLVLGVGRADELYQGIGRGQLNIEGLPVYRDKIGGIGTPTSDEERTKIEMNTADLLMLVNAYSGISGLEDTAAWTIEVLQKYAAATQISSTIIASK